MAVNGKLPGDKDDESARKGPLLAIIERDYTCSSSIQFIEECPVRIQHLVDRDIIVSIIRNINQALAQAEKITLTRLLRNIANVLTLGLIDTFAPGPIVAAMRNIDTYVNKQNESVLRPLGLTMHTPSESGMLQITIECL